MERLQIEDFLVFQEVDLEIDKFIALIGPQASGKSLIAKLLYFFRKFLRDIYIESINKNQTKRQVEREGLKLFEQYFPRYAWGSKAFRVVYTADEDIKVRIQRKRDNKGELRIKLDYSKRLAQLHRRYKMEYRRYKEREQELPTVRQRGKTDEVAIRLGRNSWKGFQLEHLSNFRGKYTHHSIFIPAGRSFFANLQKNVFSFLAGDIDIDPFIKEFGSSYENSKRLYTLWQNRFRHGDKSAEALQIRIDNLMQSILAGKYIFHDDQDWIEGNNTRINLSNASSGQQEALPMLLMLSLLPFLFEQIATFFIEEPEVHLFPTAQQQIVNLLSLLYANNQRIVITTHSPYILTALNNLILAGDIVARNKQQSSKIEKILSGGLPVQYDDVGAYIVADGGVRSIKDNENRLIGASLIDNVSDEFEDIFNALLNIEEELNE